MLDQRINRGVGVSVLQGVEYLRVIVIGLFSKGGLVGQRGTDVHHRCVLEVADDGGQARRGRRLIDRHVEHPIAIHPFRRVRLVEHALMQIAETLQERVAEVGDRLSHGQRLENHPYLVDVVNVLAAELGDDGSPVRVELDQTFGGEVPQRLSHRGGAHVEHRGKLGLDEPGPAGELPVEDRPAENTAHVLVGSLAGCGLISSETQNGFGGRLHV